jgi:hypothetical protein
MKEAVVDEMQDCNMAIIITVSGAGHLISLPQLFFHSLTGIQLL